MRDIERRVDNFIEKIGGVNYLINVKDFRNFLIDNYKLKRWNKTNKKRIYEIINNVELKKDLIDIFIDHPEFKKLKTSK